VVRGWTEASASCWLFWSPKKHGFVRWEARSSQLLVAFPKNHPGGLPVTPFEKRGKKWEMGKKICGIDFLRIQGSS